MSGLPDDPPAAVFGDARGGGRALRATWHAEARVLVLSIWRDDVCIASHRLAAADLPAFAHLLTETMTDALAGQATAVQPRVTETPEPLPPYAGTR